MAIQTTQQATDSSQLSNLTTSDNSHELDGIYSAPFTGLEDTLSADDGPYDLEQAATQQSTGPTVSLEKVKTAADWNGADDKDNPMNWSIAKRVYHTFAIAMLAFAVTFGSSVITPATPEIEEYFSVSRTVAILPLTLYVVSSRQRS